MKLLVANLGSTSFKHRLFDMTDERVLARGGVERIGSPRSRCFVEAGAVRQETDIEAKDHAAAVRVCLKQLSDPKIGALKAPSELAAIGFKAVHAQGMTGVQRVNDKVLSAMEAFAETYMAYIASGGNADVASSWSGNSGAAKRLQAEKYGKAFKVVERVLRGVAERESDWIKP